MKSSALDKLERNAIATLDQMFEDDKSINHSKVERHREDDEQSKKMYEKWNQDK